MSLNEYVFKKACKGQHHTMIKAQVEEIQLLPIKSASKL